MHIYLRLVNESGDPSVAQIPEEGFQSVEVGSKGCVFSGVTVNFDTACMPQSIQALPCVLQILFI